MSLFAPAPRLLLRRLFAEILCLSLLCLGSLVTLIVVGRFLQLRDLLMGLDLGLIDLLRLFFYMSPFFLLILIPVACMLSIFLTFLRMSTDRELLALKSGGVSLYQLLPAPLIFCVLCTAATLFISMYGVSWGIDHFRSEVVRFLKTKTQLVLQPGVFNQQFPGIMIYARQVDNTQGLLEHIIVEDRSKEEATSTILAPVGRIQTVPEQGRFVIALENGRIYRQNRDNISVLSFERYQVGLDLSKLIGKFHLFNLYAPEPKELSYAKLLEIRADRSLMKDYYYGEVEWQKIQVEIQKRRALPFACLVLGICAVPLACAFEGLKRHFGVILALGFFLLYYSLLSFGLSLSETNVVSPVLGLWTPNGFILFLGLVGIWLTARERTPNLVERLRHWQPIRRILGERT